jgi:WXG100 family type VII secretion target
MASLKLHVTYETIEQAVQENENVKEDFRGQLANINSALDAMSSSFKGKAGRSFMNYWGGSGKAHSEALIRHIEKLDQQLDEIKKLVEENDDACAAMFQWGM